MLLLQLSKNTSCVVCEAKQASGRCPLACFKLDRQASCLPFDDRIGGLLHKITNYAKIHTGARNAQFIKNNKLQVLLIPKDCVYSPHKQA
jgi:hypothetical protein